MRDFFAQVSELIKRTWIGLIVVIMIVVAAIGSVESYRESVLEIESGVKLESTNELSFASEEIDTLNPIISQSEDMFYISKLIYDSLFDFNSNMNVNKVLVEDFSVDTEKGKLTVELKDDVQWHNGDDLTASDVKFTIDAIKSAGKNSIYFDKVNKINYAVVKGDSEVEILFKKADDAALDNLTFPIVCSKDFSSPSAAARDEEYTPNGTGQYKYSSYNRLKSLNLVPNKEYFGTVSKKNITVKILPDKELASQMLSIDAITCYIDKNADRKYIAEDKELKLYNIPLNEAEIIVFNQENEFTSNKIVRKAIAHAIDNENVLENGYMGDGIITDTIYYPNFLGSTEDGNYYTYGISSVKTLLKGIGFEDFDDDGIIENEDSEEAKELELKLVVNKSNSTRLAAARIIEDSLMEAGFRVELAELSWEEYEEAIKKKDFDLLFTGFSFNEQYDLRFLFDGKNDWKFKDKAMLEQLDGLEELHTPNEYTDIYSEIKNIMMEELPYYSLCYKQQSLIGGKYFQASDMPIFNDIYRNCSTWNWQYEVHKNVEDDSNTNN